MPDTKPERLLDDLLFFAEKEPRTFSGGEWCKTGVELTLRAAHTRIKELEAKYHELLWAVESKSPGQSRHETALSYIQAAECSSDNQAYCENTPTEGEGDG